MIELNAAHAIRLEHEMHALRLEHEIAKIHAEHVGNLQLLTDAGLELEAWWQWHRRATQMDRERVLCPEIAIGHLHAAALCVDRYRNQNRGATS